MIDSKYRISLDVNSTVSNVRLKCKRGDTGRSIYVALTESGYPYHITDDCYAAFTATKPDGKKVYNGCSIDGCVIIYELTPQTVAVPGLVKCEIKLYGANDKLITSASFLLEVYNAQVNDGDELESETEVEALTQLISQAIGMNAKLEKLPNFGSGAKVGDYLMVSEVDKEKRMVTVIPVEAVDAPSGGSNAGSSIPAYVATEAEAVIDRIIAAQGIRTFNIAAITDMHYGSWGYYEGVTDYRDGVNHACRALKYIDERIKLDAVAALGDYTDGLAQTQQGTAVADFKGVNAELDQLRFAPNLRLRGNHDFVADKSPLAYRYIGAYNDGAVEWGDALGGYFFKDFATQKIRVICLNTSETGNGGVDCSVEQYQWFVHSLNLSEKDDASEWGILILSHIPLDMWPGNGVYRFAYILNAYKKGTSWTDNTVSCDFSGGKNAAALVANIHGHVHNCKVDKLYLGNIEASTTQIDVWRMATPNACFGLENKDYAGYKETIAYPKTANSTKDTAFCVYCIDLDSHTITSVCYGAGYDRTLNYQSGDIVVGETHSITNNLTNVTNSNNANAVEDGSAYSATLTPSGEMTNVTVTMGGVDITASAYSNGVIKIPAVTGDVIITAIAVAVEIVNALISSVNADGTPYNNGQGWKADTRWSGSSGAEQSPYAGVYLSGYIPYDGKEGTVYLRNVSTTSRLKVWYFERDSMTKFTYQRELAQNQIPNVVYGDDGNVASFKLEKDCDYIRIECGGFSADSIVTINQPIE